MTTRYHPEYGVCNRCPRRTELYYYEPEDEYLCEDCIDNLNEIAYDNHQTSLMENGPGPSLLDQQNAARKLK